MWGRSGVRAKVKRSEPRKFLGLTASDWFWGVLAVIAVIVIHNSGKHTRVIVERNCGVQEDAEPTWGNWSVYLRGGGALTKRGAALRSRNETTVAWL